jgi:hypothetical protein
VSKKLELMMARITCPCADDAAAVATKFEAGGYSVEIMNDLDESE